MIDLEQKVLVDALGRKITIKNLSVVDQAQVLRTAGPDQANNQPYVMMIECLYMVQDIDGNPAMRPVNERQVDAALGKLGDHGMARVMEHRYREMRAVQDAAERAANGEGDGGMARADPLPKPAPSLNSDL